jgi:hypothetical protein
MIVVQTPRAMCSKSYWRIMNERLRKCFGKLVQNSTNIRRRGMRMRGKRQYLIDKFIVYLKR